MFLTAGERDVKYFRNEHGFITGNNVPKSEILRKDHIKAEYDELDRLILKSKVNAQGKVIAQEQYSYTGTNMIIRQKDLVDNKGHIFHQTIFGREPQSLSYIEWVFGVDSVKKWNDRFTTSNLNELDKPNDYRFFDVDAYEYGGKELEYDSLGRTTRDEWFRRPDGKSMHKFLYKYYDDLGITHMFEYDSNGVLIMDVKLSGDGTEALFWFTGPADSSFQNHSEITYNLDGDLTWGKVIWAIPGELDSSSVDLSDIYAGDYTVSLVNDSMLQDSSIYDIHFNGKGVKGYMATKRTINHITYDISPPIMTLDMDTYMKDVSISFTHSEPIDSAYIVWVPNSNFSHVPLDTVILTKEEIDKSDRFKPYNQSPLIDGVMYNPEIYAIDRAGNLADPPGLKENVIYDITQPALSINEPNAGEWLNHQLFYMSTNEPIQSWTFIAKWQGGSFDENAPYTHTFTDTVLDTANVNLADYFQLNDGSTYAFSIIGNDLAGNVSDTTQIDSIHYDTTPPVLTMIFPFNDAAINNPTVSYASSELLLAGEFLWTEINGSEDSVSSHRVELIDDELSAEEKIHINLTNEPILTDGSTYTILLTGRDLAGNESDPVVITNVLFDITPPNFTNTFPETGGALNHQSVSYTISESIQKGSITWIQMSGILDENSPHVIPFVEDEMSKGVHERITLKNMSTLQDGGIYTIHFTGLDRAGNMADTITVTNVLYDYTPPEMIIDYPLPRSISSTTEISFTLSEDLHQGEFKWIWLGGVEDTLAPYIAELIDDELKEGAHTEIELKNIPNVVENALYTLSFSGQDRAGNQTLKVFVPGLQYDFTPPELTWYSPKSGDAVNHKKIHFENSEMLDRGTMSWIWVGGVVDPDSSHAMILTGDELRGEEFPEGVITNAPMLIDGSTYNISYIAFDPAGNESNHILVENILYDITKPEVAIIYPLPRSISRTSAVTYTLSEELFEGQFKWRWLGGIEDTLAPYISILSEEERTAGEHVEILLENNPSVVENALYMMTILGRDRAGNKTEPAFVQGLQYDFTPPELTIISPKDSIAINQKNVHYVNSELLETAQMIWQWTGGEPDNNSPHFVNLVMDELQGDEIGPIVLSNSPDLVDGAIYSLLYVALDPAGNQSDTTRKVDILFDVTPPKITITYPSSNIFTTETKLLFDSSEDIYDFIIKWNGIRIGETDNLILYENPNVLTAGSINSDDLFIPELKDGYRYTITLSGVDRAGNLSTTAELNDVKIDLTPPEFTSFSPLSGTFINHMNFGWTLSEDIEAGSVEFISSGGTQVVDLSGEEKNMGERIPSILENVATLVDGFQYTISIQGSDFAGNISEPLTVNQVSYDISPPEMITALPKSDSFVNLVEVVYGSNEPLIAGQMIWIETAGETQSFDLRLEDLSQGKRTLRNYGIKPKEGVAYQILIKGTDRANNVATSDTIKNVLFDITPPQLVIQSPISNEPVNHTKLSFNISEKIEMGTIRWEALEGNDPKSPHLRSIPSDQLESGSYQDFVFMSPPELVNGVSYNIVIEGEDLAGNKSQPMSVDLVLYDTTPPKFVDIKPNDGEFIREADITYTLTENVANGKIYFDYVGGEVDAKTTHMITLAGSKKEQGTQGGKLPSSFVQLVNGAIYNMRFEGQDAAGNSAPETLVKNITFDNEVPVVTISTPLSESYINDPSIIYNLSENVISGKIVLTRESGKADNNSPHSITLTDNDMIEGDHIISSIKWVDGTTYSLAFLSANDRAGNAAKPVKISQIKYDVTPPIISIDNINNNKHIRYNTLSYTLSEILSNSSIIFTQIGGEEDPASPQSIELIGKELNGEIFIDKKLQNGPNLINGAIYDIVFIGSDPAGNDALNVSISNITFDNQEPKISISRPLDSEQIKSTLISFMSDENLETGYVIFNQTSGTADINSPHRIPIPSENLSKGVHSDIDLGFTSKLADGGRYQVTIEAFDKAGNSANVTPINDVFFDVLPPNLTLSDPASGSRINSASISYGTSEEMGKANIVFTRTGGTEDPLSPHVVELTGDRLKFGDHISEPFDGDTKLIDGSVYSIEFSGEDLAGNVAVNISQKDITYDILPPEITITSPESGGFYSKINLAFELKETLEEGRIIFERQGGIDDPMSPHDIELTADQLIKGLKTGINISTLTSLTANTTYSVRIEATDLAGNKGNSEEISNVTFDDVPPDISITSPNPDAFINSTTIGLKTNEILSEAKVVWTWVDGNTDATGTHESKLVGDQLMDGQYPRVNFDPAPSLVSDARYTVEFFGIDRAGNASKFELGAVYFDNIPPVLNGSFPISNGFTNLNEVAYDLNEPLLNAILTWESTDGSSVVTVDLIGDELKPGIFNQGKLNNQKDLIDGLNYNLNISAYDRAGNVSNVTLADNVMYDKTKPKFTDVEPTTSSRINSQLIKWTINEELISGKYTWIHMGGAQDPSAPHTFDLTPELFNVGSFDNTSLGDLNLVADAMYRITLEGTDKAGNTGKKFIMSVVYDDKPPTLEIKYPESNMAVNNLEVAYFIDEGLRSGQFIYTQVDGLPDPNSPVTFDLTGVELESIFESPKTPKNPPVLNDGSIYNIQFKGEDLARNASESNIIENVKYDITRPVITIYYPAKKSNFMGTEIDIEISEDLKDGTMIWSRTGGLKDRVTKHKIPLFDQYLAQGRHEKAKLPMEKSLSSSVIYSLGVEAQDFAGNQAEPVLVEFIEYIRNMAGKWYYKGQIIEVVWEFEPDETGLKGNFMQGLSLGTKISDQEQGQFTLDFSSKPWVINLEMENPDKNRISLFKFLNNNRIRVVTGEKKPRDMNDGEIMEYEWRPD